MAKGKNYRSQMDANLGVPPDHPGGSVKAKAVPGAASAHKAFVSPSNKTNFNAVAQPSPQAGHAGHPHKGVKRTIKAAK